MKLMEIKEFKRLDEGMAFPLDAMELYKSYGSWWHFRKPTPIYVKDLHGHVKTAKEITQENPDPDKSDYHKMFDLGYVRAVHNGMADFTLSGTKRALKALLPKLAELQEIASKITIDVEDCSSGRCQSVDSGSFVMPAQWGEITRILA